MPIQSQRPQRAIVFAEGASWEKKNIYFSCTRMHVIELQCDASRIMDLAWKHLHTWCIFCTTVTFTLSSRWLHVTFFLLSAVRKKRSSYWKTSRIIYWTKVFSSFFIQYTFHLKVNIRSQNIKANTLIPDKGAMNLHDIQKCYQKYIGNIVVKQSNKIILNSNMKKLS